jgi:uncharacterized repeat protein (TIGR03803 family)
MPKSMKSICPSMIRNLGVLLKSVGPVLVALFLTIASSTAQTFTTLKSFGDLTYVRGSYPHAPLVRGPYGTLYGTTRNGGHSVQGTVFKLQPDGSGFTVLKWFTNDLEATTPFGGLVLFGDTLYGTTSQGGSSGAGTVFKVNTDGTGFAVLKEFAFVDGAAPAWALALCEFSPDRKALMARSANVRFLLFNPTAA